MDQRTSFKSLVSRRSTRAQLRQLQSVVRGLQRSLANEWFHGKDLQKLCLGKSDILLHIGCGELVKDGWINVDFQARRGVCYFDALNPLPIADGTVAHLHAEHFLEHLPFDDAVRFLSECFRVLKKEGTMRIIVPDAEKYMRAYSSGDGAFFEKLDHLGDSVESLPTPAAICNQMFHMGGNHFFGWDFDTLEHVTTQMGFRSITRSAYNDEDCLFCIDGQDWWRQVESLYVNLVR